MKRAEQIAALTRIAAVGQDVALARLAEAAGRQKALAGKIAALDELAATARAEAAGDVQPVTHAARETFGRWVALQRTELSRRAADVSTEVAVRRAEAAQAFGKCQALGALGTRSARRPG